MKASRVVVLSLLVAMCGPLQNLAAQDNIRYVRWLDPAEHAFSDLVPSGWRVGGRLVRYSPVTIAPFVQAMTPDGTIFIQLGDWRIKDYSDIPGWKQGQLYTPGSSVIIVRRLETADQYVRSYSLSFEKQLGCENPAVTGMEPQPTPAGLSFVPGSKVQTAMVHFKCQRGGQPYVGQVMATVEAYRVPLAVSWNVMYLACLFARADRAPTGVAVWNKMRLSIAFQPDWTAREGRIATASTALARAQLDRVMKEIQDFNQHVINGNVTVNDPLQGTQSEIKMGVEPFYFSNGQGHFYNSYDPTPRNGFHSVTPKR